LAAVEPDGGLGEGREYGCQWARVVGFIVRHEPEKAVADDPSREK
jgi:hypothetical protein